MSTTSTRTSSSSSKDQGGATAKPSGALGARLAFAWTVVGVPLAYGIYETAKKASALFTG